MCVKAFFLFNTSDGGEGLYLRERKCLFMCWRGVGGMKVYVIPKLSVSESM